MPHTQTSLVLFHCSFADHGPCVQAHQAYDARTYLTLPYLYAVCVVDESSRPERMASGFMLKTDVEFGEPGFRDCLESAVRAVPQLDRQRLHGDVCLLPAAVDHEADHFLTGPQALLVFQHLWSEHVTHQLMGRLTHRAAR